MGCQRKRQVAGVPGVPGAKERVPPGDLEEMSRDRQSLVVRGDKSEFDS